MVRFLIVAAFGAGASLALPSPASADRSDCPRKLERSYSKHYRMVAHRHGTRAPGRNIRRYGVQVRWSGHKATFDAMCSELRRSRRQLKKLLAPPKPWPAQYATAPVPPPQRPAGTSSAAQVATGSGGSSNAYVNPACESGGNPHINTGNGYYGKYQFDIQTWQAHGGGPGLPSNYSEAEQDRIAANVQYDAWPNC